MKTQFIKMMIAGVAWTVVMTIVAAIAPMMGMPEIFSAPPMQAMLLTMMGSAMGHLVYGLSLAFVYTIKIESSRE